MKPSFKAKIFFFVFIFLFLIGAYFVFSFSQNQKVSYPNPQNYAPNFWFDSEENYYPCNPLDFNYDKDLNEIPAEEAKEKYDSLSKEERLNHFTVFYNIVDESTQWIYEYHLYYVFNKFANEHYGDWEWVDVYVDKNSKKPIKVIGSAHFGSKSKIFLANNELDNPKKNHQRILVEKGSHANIPDGNNDGLFDRNEDVSNWIGAYSLIFHDWSLQDKLYGVKIEWNDPRYKLVSIESLKEKYSQKYSRNRRMITKAKNLGVDVVKVLKINKISYFQNKHFYLVRKLSGSPPSNPWIRKEFSQPEIAQPINLVEIAKKEIKGIGGSFAFLIETISQKVKVISQKAFKNQNQEKEKEKEKERNLKAQLTEKNKNQVKKLESKHSNILQNVGISKRINLSERVNSNIKTTNSSLKTKQIGLFKPVLRSVLASSSESSSELSEIPKSSPILRPRFTPISIPTSTLSSSSFSFSSSSSSLIPTSTSTPIPTPRLTLSSLSIPSSKSVLSSTSKFFFCQIPSKPLPKYKPIIFNEIAWMGSKKSGSDEWIELKNLWNRDLNLDGYQIIGISTKTNKTKIKILLTGKILKNNFFLLERTDDNSVPEIKADFIYKGGLNNSSYKLYLFNKNCQLLDYIEASKKWPAGENSSKRTMERGSDLSWHTYYGSGTPLGKERIFGTPKAPNSTKKLFSAKGGSLVFKNKTQTFVSYCSLPENPLPTSTPFLIFNEVAWMGSSKNYRDEWIELKNVSGKNLEIKNFQIKNYYDGILMSWSESASHNSVENVIGN